jgi:hypothetical protein
MTPQEAAKLVDCPRPDGNKEIHGFLFTASARDIQLFVHNIQTNTTDAKGWRERAEVALNVRAAEDAKKSSEKLAAQTDALAEHVKNLVEIADAQKQLANEASKQAENLSNQTTRLVDETVKLTGFKRGVYWFTVVIGFFAFVQIVIMLFEYFSKTH